MFIRPVVSSASIPINDPTDIATIALWLDGSDVATMYQISGSASPVTTDGQQLGTWEDKSGNGYHVEQTASGQKPHYRTGQQNSLSTVLNENSVADEFLFRTSSVLTQTIEVTLFWVASSVAASDSLPRSVYASNDANIGGGRVQAYVDTRVIGSAPKVGVLTDGTDSANPALLAQTSANTYNQYSLRNNGTNAIGRKDGTEQESKDSTAVGSATNDYTRIFNSQGDSLDLEGGIGELIIYDSALSDIDILRVETYLKDKWATP